MEKNVKDELIQQELDRHPILGADKKDEQEEEEEMSYEQFLIYSARMGLIDDVKEMLDVRDPPVDINYRDQSVGYNTALHMASANGFVDIVKLLLQQQGQNGAAVINVNIQNESGNTALHYASLNGKKDVVQELLLFIPKNINSNSQQINSSNQIIKKIDANIKNNMGRIAFEEGLQAGHGDIAEMLAPLSKLDDDKMYYPSNLDDIAEPQEGDDLFDVKEELVNVQVDEHGNLIEEESKTQAQSNKNGKNIEDDKMSVQSEECIRQEDDQIKRKKHSNNKSDVNQPGSEKQKLEEVGEKIKEKFGMQEFEVEIKKIN